jgi:hypothetical protein
VLFSNIQVNPLFDNGGVVTLGNFTPVNDGHNFGLAMNFISEAFVPNSHSDIAWTYNVSALPGFLLSDVFLELAGTATGTGSIRVSEVLSNNVTLELLQAGTTSAIFSTPVAALLVLKNQFNRAGANGTAETTLLVNAFSVSPVPLPGALALMGTALAGGFGFAGWRKRRNKGTASLASA